MKKTKTENREKNQEFKITEIKLVFGGGLLLRVEPGNNIS